MEPIRTTVPGEEYCHPLISERAVDKPRRLKVIYIGAGISGICAAILFPKYVPNLDLVIYDKNKDLGGTWYENKYPGCACGMPQNSVHHRRLHLLTFLTRYSRPFLPVELRIVDRLESILRHCSGNFGVLEQGWRKT